ncbi:MAG: PilN domain-containing protein [Acidimicrobiia bacterium]|nr:PilN domain-containing protein [Acidimicrobiia bacterium]MDH3397861.1 PilN domain-containing protein [Acidimicrobiia bacterium]
MRTINLLPPEAAQRATARRKSVGFIALGFFYVVLLALVALWWQGKATDAESDRDAQLAANSRIEAEIGSLAGVRALRSTYDDGVERLDSALVQDIAWGRLLNDLARIIPDRLWITSLTGNVQEDEENPFLLGQVSVTGVAFDFSDASSWLRVLDAEEWPALGGGWVSSTSRSTIGESPVVNFTSVASLLDPARSNRVEERTPEVPS